MHRKGSFLDRDTYEKQQHADDYRRKQDSAPEMVPFYGRVVILKIPMILFPCLAAFGTQGEFDTQIRHTADTKAGSGD